MMGRLVLNCSLSGYIAVQCMSQRMRLTSVFGP